jgi:hypothetical protein
MTASAQEKKCFDSADWALAKEGKKQAADTIPAAPVAAPVPELHHATHSGSTLKPRC